MTQKVNFCRISPTKDITCYRDQEIAREICSLPAATYNLAQTLLSHANPGFVFVPIRTMQYLAIIDTEEIVFIDSAEKELVKISSTRPHRFGQKEKIIFS